MKTITLNTAIADLPAVIATTIKNQEKTIIETDNGAVVMIDENVWNNSDL